MALRKRKVDHGTPGEIRDNVVEAPIPRRLSVSETLRGRRLDCGLEIAHVAEILRIRPPVLEAIENGRFDQLPGSAYAVGFVRSYADLSRPQTPRSLVLRFKAEVENVSRKPNLKFPLPVNESRVPTGAVMLIGFLLAAIAYGGWYYFSAQHGDISNIVSAVPDRLTHLVSPDQVKVKGHRRQRRERSPRASGAGSPKFKCPARLAVAYNLYAGAAWWPGRRQRAASRLRRSLRPPPGLARRPWRRPSLPASVRPVNPGVPRCCRPATPTTYPPWPTGRGRPTPLPPCPPNPIWRGPR